MLIPHEPDHVENRLTIPATHQEDEQTVYRHRLVPPLRLRLRHCRG